MSERGADVAGGRRTETTAGTAAAPMCRRLAAGLVVLSAGLLVACSGSEPQQPETASTEATRSTPPPESYRVAEYPTPADADAAFVSEVAALDGIGGYLLRDPYILSTDLTEHAARIAAAGRWACATYNGNNIESVVSQLSSQIMADTIDPVSLDSIDGAAFVVAAAGVYCPESLVDLGEGRAMKGGVITEPVTPVCPAEPPVTVDVSPIQLDGYSNVEEYGDLGADNDLVYGDTDGLYDGTWTYTLTNHSAYGAMVELEERVLSARYDTEWAAPKGDAVLVAAPFYVPAGGNVTANGRISGVYAWEAAEYRIASWLPVDCAVQLE